MHLQHHAILNDQDGAAGFVDFDVNYAIVSM